MEAGASSMLAWPRWSTNPGALQAISLPTDSEPWLTVAGVGVLVAK